MLRSGSVKFGGSPPAARAAVRNEKLGIGVVPADDSYSSTFRFFGRKIGALGPIFRLLRNPGSPTIGFGNCTIGQKVFLTRFRPHGTLMVVTHQKMCLIRAILFTGGKFEEHTQQLSLSVFDQVIL